MFHVISLLVDVPGTKFTRIDAPIGPIIGHYPSHMENNGRTKRNKVLAAR